MSKSILQRLEELEVQVQQLRTMGAQTQNAQTVGRQTLAIVQALIKEVGVAIFGENGAKTLDERIYKNLQEAQQAAVKQRQADQKRIVEDMVKSGQLKASEVVTDESILALTESQIFPPKEGDTAESKSVTQEYVQLHISQLDPKLAEAFKGKASGFELRDGDFELKIVGIFDPVPSDQQPAVSDVAVEAPAQETTSTPKATP